MSTTISLSAMIGAVALLAVGTGDLIEVAKEGGTLGGQVLLFMAVVVLGWVVVALFRGQQKSTAEALLASNAQREEDRKHHQEIVEAFRAERSGNIAERGVNFQTLLIIARDSAVAISASTAATLETTQACRETASAIRDLGVAFRELRASAHEDAINPVVRKTKIVNKPNEAVPIVQK